MKKKQNIFRRRTNLVGAIAGSFGVFAYICAIVFEIFLAQINAVTFAQSIANPIYRDPMIGSLIGLLLSLVLIVVAVKVPPRYYRYGVFSLAIIVLAANIMSLVFLIGKTIHYFQTETQLNLSSPPTVVMFASLLLAITLLIISILFAFMDIIFTFPRGKADQEATIFEAEQRAYEEEKKRQLAEPKPDPEVVKLEAEKENARIREFNQQIFNTVEPSPNVVPLDDPLHPELIINYNISFDTPPSPRPLTAPEQIVYIEKLKELYQAGILQKHEVEAYKKRIIGRDIIEK